MPELPEIETIRRKLRDRLISRRLLHITLRRNDLRYPIPAKKMREALECDVIDVRRRSKYLLLDFSGDTSFIVHLGMSGRFFFTERGSKLNKHDHVLLDFGPLINLRLRDNGLHLRLRDPRRFGALDVCATSRLNDHRFIKNLGLEPFDDNFNGESLFALTQKSNSPIKVFLMNAKFLVGVGNIYASEALFLAHIRPMRRACKIKRDQAARLCQSIKQVLTESITLGGTTFRDYVDVDGRPGLHQLALKVYSRAGEACFVCGSHIKRAVMGQRSTFFCPACQR